MIARIAFMLMASLASIATAQTTRSSPATQPSPDELHAQAVELMRQGQFPKARPLLEKAYNALPPEQRTRPIILNRAMLDTTHKAFVMRALRELTEYLTKNRTPDEPATNALGIALDVSARDPKQKRSELWQNALREWDRRNYLMDRGRPGYRRWGTKWLSDEQYAEMASDRRDLEERITDQEARYERAQWRANVADTRVQSLRYEARVLGNLVVDDSSMPQSQRDLARRRAGLATQPAGAIRTVTTIRTDSAALTAAVRRAELEADEAKAEISAESARLRQLLSQRPRPNWPKTLPPVDPAEVNAPPIPPPDPKAAAEYEARRKAAGLVGAPTTAPTAPFDPREIDGGSAR